MARGLLPTAFLLIHLLDAAVPRFLVLFRAETGCNPFLRHSPVVRDSSILRRLQLAGHGFSFGLWKKLSDGAGTVLAMLRLYPVYYRLHECQGKMQVFVQFLIELGKSSSLIVIVPPRNYKASLLMQFY